MSTTNGRQMEEERADILSPLQRRVREARAAGMMNEEIGIAMILGTMIEGLIDGIINEMIRETGIEVVEEIATEEMIGVTEADHQLKEGAGVSNRSK